MPLIFAAIAGPPMLPNGLDVAAPSGGPPGGGWTVRQSFHVTATNPTFNAPAYEVQETEIGATAGGSLFTLAGEGHNPYVGWRPLGGAGVVDLVGSGADYPWVGVGFIQWDIPYTIRDATTLAVVSTGVVIQKISVDAMGTVTLAKGNFSAVMGGLPDDRQLT